MLKRNLWLGTLVLGLCAAYDARAAQYKTAIDDGVVEAVVSAKDPSRLSVYGDRISLVSRKKEGSGFSYRADKQSGDLFISIDPPQPGEKPKIVNFFIVTEKGHTYQLMLTPKDIPSEQIILRNPKMGEQAAVAWEKRTPYVDTMTRLIGAMIRDETPRGFTVKASDDEFTMGEDLRLVRRRVYIGGVSRGEVYEVTNSGDAALTLSEAAFKRQGVRAVSLSSTTIKPKGTALVYVVVERVAR